MQGTHIQQLNDIPRRMQGVVGLADKVMYCMANNYAVGDVENA